ncbi:MAG: DNA photolyase family protein [Acidiferrobacterales bacterium]|nr:DNA photolyase family protein [Acidiferrobacterales bacterium]
MSDKPKINIVWFKRDLRLSDHEPLKLAQDSGLPILLLYVFEPELLNDAHYSERHWRFVTESLLDMNRRLPGKVSVANDEIVNVLNKISNHYQIDCLFSHEETGLANTYQRDKAVARWAGNQKVNWCERQTGAVIRPCNNRDDWDKQWKSVMRAEIEPILVKNLNLVYLDFDTSQLPAVWKNRDLRFQLGGSKAGWRVLDDFFESRGKDYHWFISKPLQSRTSCSRMSPYLAWGNISLREMYQHVLSHWNRKGWRRSLVALTSRLHWHCHFIQKFESESTMQFDHINAGYQRIPYRENRQAEDDLLAWKRGQTGYPLIDACMRCLQETGYINFRMRAMLVSFLCHHLQIDWRRGVAHLANLFLDFEPGIHYAQFQMQAGVTGTNTIRIYNPTKQAKEQDPDGTFIRRWCPEIAALPDALLFEPWLLTSMEELMYEIRLGGTYPRPIVDVTTSYREASELLWSWRKRDEVKAEAKRIVRRHVRTKN